MTTNTMTKPRQILLDHIGRGTTFYLTPQEKERLLECIKVVDSHKEAVQSNCKYHQDLMSEVEKKKSTCQHKTGKYLFTDSTHMDVYECKKCGKEII